MVVPNLMLAPAVIGAFRDYCSITGLLLDHIDKGRLGVEGEASVELASGSANGAIITRHESARRDGQSYCW
jgi:hypothetical protein